MFTEEESNVYYRPFLVGGVNVFDSNGQITNEVLEFIDNNTGKILPDKIPGLNNVSILNESVNVILTQNLPANLETINESLLTSSNLINTSYLPFDLQNIDQNLFDNYNRIELSYFSTNLQTIENTFLISNTQINPDVLPANVQTAENLLTSENKIDDSFLSTNLVTINDNFLMENNTEINYSYYTENLVNIDTNVLTDFSPGNLNYDIISANLQFLDQNALECSTCNRFNMHIFPNNFGFFTATLDVTNNYFIYISNTGDFANMGEYNTSTLVFTEYGNVIFEDNLEYAPFDIIGYEHTVVDLEYSYKLLNILSMVFFIFYDDADNGRPTYIPCFKTTWPPT